MKDNNKENKFSNESILEIIVSSFVALVIVALMVKIVFF